MQLRLLTFLCISILFISCDFSSKTKNPSIELGDSNKDFTGKIELENVEEGVRTEITFIIGKDRIKREQRYKYAGIPTNRAGIIVDKSKNEVILYSNDSSAMYTVSTIEEYKKYLQENLFDYYSYVSSYDYTYSYLDDYISIASKKDVKQLPDVTLNYNLYTDEYIRQEVFDTGDFNVDRSIVEIVFPGVPSDVKFPLLFKITKSDPKDDPVLGKLSENEWTQHIADVLDNLSTLETKVKSISKEEVSDEDFTFNTDKFDLVTNDIFFRSHFSTGSGGSSWGDDD